MPRPAPFSKRERAEPPEYGLEIGAGQDPAGDLLDPELLGFVAPGEVPGFILEDAAQPDQVHDFVGQDVDEEVVEMVDEPFCLAAARMPGSLSSMR